ncbi:MAG TPA: translation initiation factor IF-2 [Bacillota bacterium]|nr:translation initiation factor IF-2 [Bacillota bacterium]
MSKIRIFELAEELEIPADKLVDALRDLELNISSPMSMVDTTVAGIIREIISSQKKKKKRPAGQKAVKPPAQEAEPESTGPILVEEALIPVADFPEPEPVLPAPVVVEKPKPAPAAGSGRDRKDGKKPGESADRGRGSRPKSAREISAEEQNRRKTSSQRGKGQKVSPAPQNGRQQNSAVIDHAIVDENMTVGELAKAIGKSPAEIIKKLFDLGVMATINQSLDADTMGIVASEFNMTLEIKSAEREKVEEEPADPPECLKPRYPVVTVLGHVDHGKTSLLDVIRQANVTASEAGGITQHIGAYQVDIGDQKIVFLDTPGHEAFTAMRARGAEVTDIAILVVAADDGVMPQTVEALSHAKAAGVPIIVAVNKIDKAGANPERVKQQLTEYGLVAEQWGGDTIFVEVSALQKLGIEDLLTSVLTVAEVLELKANPDRAAQGVVIEAQVDKGRGPVATVLVQRGTLNVGDSIVAGAAHGKIRGMLNDRGKRIRKAGPSTPLEIQGLSSAPMAGDTFKVVKDDKTARALAEATGAVRKADEQKSVHKVSLDEFFSQLKTGKTKELRLIIKGDVQGSVEALRPAVEKLSNEEVDVKVIHTGVGPVNESDIMLANASNAIVIGFNVRAEVNARKAAEAESVDVRYYRIIYEVIDNITAALKGMLAPVFKEVVIGQVEVRAVFRVTGSGVIAGSYVTEGKITRQAGVRLVRQGVVIYEGKISSLKRFKDDAREVAQGYECGIGLENFDDIKEGDVIEAFVQEEVAR